MARAKKVSPRASKVFLNIPFDRQFEPLYLAFIAGVSGFGLVPQSVLQIPGSQRRLDRLLGLLLRCRYSVHDICRVQLDNGQPKTPRFNMPFELGLAVAIAKHGGAAHDWYVFEEKKFRALKSLSDINGTEIYIHAGRPIGVFRCLVNAFGRSRHRPTVRQLQAIYRDLQIAAGDMRRNLATQDLFETRPFLDLRTVAAGAAKRRVASLN